MKINPEQLAKDIDAIPEVCKEGKDAIKKIFTNSFGVEFEKSKRFQWEGAKLPGCSYATPVEVIELFGRNYYKLFLPSANNSWVLAVYQMAKDIVADGSCYISYSLEAGFDYANYIYIVIKDSHFAKNEGE